MSKKTQFGNLPVENPEEVIGTNFEVVERGRYGILNTPVIGEEIEPTHVIVSKWVMENVIKNIEGQVLTIVEATVSDKAQLEAQKSLYRRAIWDSVNGNLFILPAVEVKN